MSDSDHDLVRYVQSGGELVLSEKRKEMFMRASFADDLIREYKLDRVVINHMVAKYRALDKSYSVSTAKRDIARARYVFGTKPAQEKEYLRGEVVDWCKEEMKKASDAGDARGFAAIANVLAKVSGLDRETPDIPDMDLLRNAPVVEYAFDPASLGGPVMTEEEKQRRLHKILHRKKDEGHDVKDLREGEDYEVMPDGK